MGLIVGAALGRDYIARKARSHSKGRSYKG